MSEPDFIAQTAEPKTPMDRWRWFKKRAGEMQKKGATWVRYTIHENDPRICLIEGWIKRPDDEGEPRFQLTQT